MSRRQLKWGTACHNPRYTGRQVWNKQRKDEALIDVDDVALRHQTRQRRNHPDAWIWSEDVVHEPLVTAEEFAAVQVQLATAGRRSVVRKPRRTDREYALTGLVHCGLCQRRMQEQLEQRQAATAASTRPSTAWPTASSTRAASTCAES